MKSIIILILTTLLIITSCNRAKTISTNVVNEANRNSYTRPTHPINDTTVNLLKLEPDTDGYYYINMNNEYCKKMSNAERAAVGFIATFIGNDCDYNDSNSYTCSVISALDLGSYGSNEHLNFLRDWFRYDTNALQQLTNPNIAPFTATIQSSFGSMNITTHDDTIIVNFVGLYSDYRENYFAKWNETDYFQTNDKSIKLIKQQKSELTEK